MSTVTVPVKTEPGHAPATKAGSLSTFLSTYVFSKDHKVIGLQFLFSTLLWFLIGGLLALAVRWQVAWPWSDVPVVGKLFAQEGGQMAPEFYTMLFTMHATVMIFLVIIPILAGAFGNFLIPLMIGADDMAFPTLADVLVNRCDQRTLCNALGVFAQHLERHTFGQVAALFCWRSRVGTEAGALKKTHLIAELIHCRRRLVPPRRRAHWLFGVAHFLRRQLHHVAELVRPLHFDRHVGR